MSTYLVIKIDAHIVYFLWKVITISQDLFGHVIFHMSVGTYETCDYNYMDNDSIKTNDLVVRVFIISKQMIDHCHL